MRTDPRLPDFFLVGAPKCGTTALSEYLREHPNVFISHPKEPFFFCDDLPGLPRISSLEAYRDLFRDAPVQARALGEASALYLYSRVALSNLRRFAENARILAMVRNPIDVAYAFHSEMLYSQNEDEPDFAQAWELQEDRRQGRSIPSRCWESALLLYGDVARMGEQIERLFGLFPREQIHVIVFDDFVRDTRAEYDRVLRFLGLPSDGRLDFPRVNENKMVRQRWLARLTQRPPALLSRAARFTKKRLGRRELSFLGPIRSANLRRGPRSTLPPDLRIRLASAFTEDVTLLGELLGRDLSAWLRPEPRERIAGGS